MAAAAAGEGAHVRALLDKVEEDAEAEIEAVDERMVDCAAARRAGRTCCRCRGRREEEVRESGEETAGAWACQEAADGDDAITACKSLSALAAVRSVFGESLTIRRTGWATADEEDGMPAPLGQCRLLVCCGASGYAAARRFWRREEDADATTALAAARELAWSMTNAATAG